MVNVACGTTVTTTDDDTLLCSPVVDLGGDLKPPETNFCDHVDLGGDLKPPETNFCNCVGRAWVFPWDFPPSFRIPPHRNFKD